MYCKEPHNRRFWRLVAELVEDGVWEETDTESEEESSESGEQDTDSDFDTEEDWVMEQIIFGEYGDDLYQ